MVISYCTTCMGRLWQLRQTLPEHLRLFSGRKDIEFVLLDYNSRDGLEDWVRAQPLLQAAIGSGLLLYAKEPTVRCFHACRAKNLAHRMARGDVLMNLDADNWVDEIDAPLRAAFAERDQIIVHGWNGLFDGSYGRIALTRGWFYQLGGYDERFESMGGQDVDIIRRAMKAGLEKRSYTGQRTPIRNTCRQKMMHTGTSLSLPEMLEKNRARSDDNLQTGRWVRNLRGWGAGTVSRNFGPPVALAPIIPESERKRACGIAPDAGPRFRHVRSAAERCKDSGRPIAKPAGGGNP